MKALDSEELLVNQSNITLEPQKCISQMVTPFQPYATDNAFAAVPRRTAFLLSIEVENALILTIVLSES